MDGWFSTHRYQIDKLKTILKTLGNLVFVIAVVFLLLKTFYLNKPDLLPLETAITYLKLEQSPKMEEIGEAKKYLSSNPEKIEVLGEKYKEVRWVQKEKEGEEPTFKEEKSAVEKDKAKITLVEKTNKNEGFIFFDFKLPKEIIFEVELTKEGDWKSGYSWKIVKINSPTLVSNKKLGEEMEIGEDIFVKPLKIEEFLPPDAKLPEEMKGLTLEVEYKNNSDKEGGFSPFSEWRIIDKDGKEYGPPSRTSARFLPEPTLFGGILNPREEIKGYVPFEVLKEIFPEKIIFKNMERKVIYQLMTND